MRSLARFSIFILLCLLFIGRSAHAQLGFTDDLTIQTFPANPGPNQKVVISISSFAIDLERADIAWTVNSKFAKRDTGLTTYAVTTGDVGSVTTVDITLRTADGAQVSKTIALRPADVTLLWYADGYAPVLYEGKILHTSGGMITVAALSNFILRGTPLGPDALFYDWRLNDQSLDNQSGLGKQTIMFQGSLLYGKDTISVTVSTKDHVLAADGQLTIQTQNPNIIFYEDDPLSGTIYENALSDTYFLKKPEITIRAEPYFISTPLLLPGKINAGWLINNIKTAGNPTFPRIITLRQNGSSGQADISYSLQGITDSLLQAARTITVFFGPSL